MVQHKKDQIRDRIDSAALNVFSQKGYLAATIADISAASGVSVGNIYRYYSTKDEMFYRLIPEDFPTQIMKAIQFKISAARSDRDQDSGDLKAATNGFFHFMLTNREKILIILSGSAGTKYESMRSELAAMLLATVKSLYENKYEAYIHKYGNDEVLLLIYENLIAAYSRTLTLCRCEEEFISRIRQIDLYHFSGITRLLELYTINSIN